MATEPNTSSNIPSPEDQIRSMRADLANGAEPKLNIPSSGKPIFDADEPVFNPNTTNPMQAQRMTAQAPTPATPAEPMQNPGVSVDDLIAQQKGKNKLGTIIGAVVGLVVLGIAAYFAVPLFTKTSDAPIATTDNNPSVPSAPVTPGEPTMPVDQGTPDKTPAKPAIPSLFMAQADKQVLVTVPKAVTPESLRDAFTKNAQDSGSAELILSKGSGSPLTFNEIIGALAPSLKAQTEKIFTGIVTSYALTDGEGIWPGYVAKLNDAATPDQIKQWFAALEKTNKANFFVSNPGTFGAFKNGVIAGNYPDRYSPASNSPASFSYLILPEKKVVVVSTSFSAIKEGVRLLGL
jgi:hypothetical protein